MPVDKFGLMGDDPSVMTNIVPIKNYALNLDDLENVEGFNNPAKKELYGFRIIDRRLYERAEMSASGALGHGGIVNKSLTFVYTKQKLAPLPLKYD